MNDKTPVWVVWQQSIVGITYGPAAISAVFSDKRLARAYAAGLPDARISEMPVRTPI